MTTALARLQFYMKAKRIALQAEPANSEMILTEQRKRPCAAKNRTSIKTEF